MPFKATVEKDKCTGCEECLEVCTTHVFEMAEGKSVPVHQEECLGCQSCGTDGFYIIRGIVGITALRMCGQTHPSVQALSVAIDTPRWKEIHSKNIRVPSPNLMILVQECEIFVTKAIWIR